MKYHFIPNAVAIYINVLGTGFAKTNAIEFNKIDNPNKIEEVMDWFNDNHRLIAKDDDIDQRSNIFATETGWGFDEALFNQKRKILYSVHMSLLNKLNATKKKNLQLLYLVF